MQAHFHPPDGGLQDYDRGLNNLPAASSLNASIGSSSDANVSFLPSGLGIIGMLTHLATHPKIKDWLQLIMLGLAAEFTRRLWRHLIVWAQEIFCITSHHATNDESYDWLMCKWSVIQKGSSNLGRNDSVLAAG
jgi:hypothetical protein